jgi:ketosteroid isomerase-like protein
MFHYLKEEKMKLKVVLILALLAALFFMGCENTDAVQELGEKFVTAFNEGDLEAVMSCWWNSPNTLLVLENGVVVQGYDNIYAGVEGLINGTEWRTLTVDEIISRFRVNDEVYTVGKATWHYKIIDGPEISFQEVWTDVAKKVGGKWVYVVDHAHDLTPFSQ